MSFRLTTLAAAVAMAMGAAATQAAGVEDIFSVRGYATVGVAHSDEDQADFTSNFFSQSEGAGATDELSFDVDSKFGVQLDINITPRLTGVVQLISEANANNTWDGDTNKDYTPSLEWANLSYKVTDNLTVRGGRVVLPFLMVSEYRKVGFANHWLRPPVEVYGQLAFTSSDGLDVNYRSKAGAGMNTARVNYGVQTIRTDLFSSQVKTLSLSDTFEIGALTLRAAYMDLRAQSPSSASLAPLFDPFIAGAASLPGGIGADAASTAARLLKKYDSTLGLSIDLFDVGAIYDPGQWFAMAEVLREESDGIVRNTTAGYVSGGYRWNKLTPYATLSFLKTEKRNEAGVPLASLPAQLAGLGGVINGILGNALNIDSSQRTLSLGLRWDIASKFALKGQYDHIDLAKDSAGLLTNLQPGFVPGGSVNLLSIAVDYVF